jgi:prepilin-type N-terminal cleavage/methylation domain-containing protein
VKWFRKGESVKRRGENLPGRLRVAARRGVTLVELMIAMLILTIVCISWLKIIGIQSARKEARRREAVERLAGMMDAFMYNHRADEHNGTWVETGSYRMNLDVSINKLTFSKDDDNKVHAIFSIDDSSIGYRLSVVEKEQLVNKTRFSGWDELVYGYEPWWLVGELYNHTGNLSDAGEPFFTLPICLGF